MGDPATRYVVYRHNWRRTETGVGRRAVAEWVRLPGEVRLAAFADAEAAEAFAREREAAARAAVNPFRCDTDKPPPAAQSHLDPPRLHDWLLDHDIPPPKPTPVKPGAAKKAIDWAKWWDAGVKKWSPAQLAAAWDAFGKVRFHTVRAEPARSVAYALVRVAWGYNDEWNYAMPEGGEVVTAYRSRERAEAECRRRNAEEWEAQRRTMAEWFDPDEMDEDFATGFEVTDRLRAAADPFAPPPKGRERDEVFAKAGEVPFFEVVEIEVEADA
jgi:hypothetical protein